jgi:hypothetical protein
MSNSSQVRFTARIVVFCVACAVLPFAAANPNGRATASSQTCGSQGDPVEVALPFETQASYLHSPPIAGLVTSLESAARRVPMNPRVRATTARPISGKRGEAYSIDPSGGVVTRADRFP